MEWTFTLENINIVAKEFWKAVKGKTVFAFHGKMGTGKTTFIHALCEEKKVKDIVGSPTFSIINEYEYDCDGTKKVMFHIDMFRLKNEEEAVKAGIEDSLFSGYICLVEWPEKAVSIFPDDTIHILIEPVDDNLRRLIITNI